MRTARWGRAEASRAAANWAPAPARLSSGPDASLAGQSWSSTALATKVSWDQKLAAVGEDELRYGTSWIWRRFWLSRRGVGASQQKESERRLDYELQCGLCAQIACSLD